MEGGGSGGDPWNVVYGGNGTYSSLAGGGSVCYAAGGAGVFSGDYGANITCGAGKGNASFTTTPRNAVENTGSGGGGAQATYVSGAGASGIVVLRYVDPMITSVDVKFTAMSDGTDDKTLTFYPYYEDIGPGHVTSWDWDFGDTGSSAVENPSHTYAADGDYDVTLHVHFDSGGSATTAKTIHVPTVQQVLTRQSYNQWSMLYYLVNDTIDSFGAAPSNITAMDMPVDMGGWIGVVTSEPKVYHVNIPDSEGYGLTYIGSDDTGSAYDIAVADSAAYSIVSRGLRANIFQTDTTMVGTYTTGGPLRAVDFAVKNGLWAVAGGEDGKIYIMSKDSTSAWYVFYQGDSDAIINADAISWRGEYVAVGRDDGSLEYYTTTGEVSATSFTSTVVVAKGGSPYIGANITIYTGDTADTTTTYVINGDTDTAGKYSFTATDLEYYKIDVNSGEYEYIYQAASGFPTITINIPVTMINTPYQWSVAYNDSTNLATVKYTDVNIATVNVSFFDVTTGKVVKLQNFTSSSVTSTYTCNKTHEYRVKIDFVRTTGQSYSDTKYIKSGGFGKITDGLSSQWSLFIGGLFVVIFSMIGLAIGPTSVKFGSVMLVSLADLAWVLGFIPDTQEIKLCLAAATFIAFLAVMRREA